MAHASLLVWDESQNVLILGQYLKKVLKNPEIIATKLMIFMAILMVVQAVIENN